VFFGDDVVPRSAHSGPGAATVSGLMRALPWLVLVVMSFSFAAVAQDDDDLAPLAPSKPRPKPAVAPRPRPKPALKPAPMVKKPAAEEDDELAPLQPAKVELLVRVAQGLTNATLLVDGKDFGSLPQPALWLPPGEHTVLVKRVGYAQFVKKVNLVVGGKPFELDARLVPLSAVLSVSSDVPDAQVFVNESLVGTAPISELELPPGSTEISVRKEGFREDKQRLALVAGKDYPVVVKFNPGTSKTVVASEDRPVQPRLTPDEPDSAGVSTVTQTAEETPISGRWYFWAGVAAVVIGTVVATGVAVNNSQPPRALTNGELCAAAGGKCDLCIGRSCTGAVPFPF